MKIQYDIEADPIYIRLREGQVDDTNEATNNVFVDIDTSGSLLGVEILYLSRHIPPQKLASVTINLAFTSAARIP